MSERCQSLDRPAIWSAIVYCLLSGRQIWHSSGTNSTPGRIFKSDPECGGGLWEQLEERSIIERSVNSCQHGKQGKSGYWIAGQQSTQWYSDGTYWLFSAVFIVWVWHDLIDTYKLESLIKRELNQSEKLYQAHTDGLTEPTPPLVEEMIWYHFILSSYIVQQGQSLQQEINQFCWNFRSYLVKSFQDQNVRNIFFILSLTFSAKKTAREV